MLTVHMIFNAHIDPIWLWPWNSGLDTLLATCRNACDRLDRHPDLHFSRGEAWVYREVERIDRELFERIKGHVQGGRWHIVGGWWIQPDCNGPSGFGFEKQIELGREYFLEKFGFFPRIGYNIDSFGHAATLPEIMRARGQDRYVFMRPQEWEMALPARVFRWRGREGGPEVTTFRIAKAYTCRGITREHIEAALSHLPEGIEHTMSFVGVGDHGGGPTESQIAWIREHQDAFPGAKLVMSSPGQFFDAIESMRERLPVVTGELQYHSVGCYSVHRPVKVAVRRAEHRLVQAEMLSRGITSGASADGRDPHATVENRLKEAWRWVCFGHFHDTFGGSCIPSACEQVHAQIGYAYAEAEDILQHAFRRRIVQALPDDKLQRIVLLNASDQPYDGYAVHEPWLEGEHWQPNWRLVDERGQTVPHQRMHTEALVPDDYLHYLRLLFRVRLEPGQMRALRIDPRGIEDKDASGLERIAHNRVNATSVSLENDIGVRLSTSGAREMVFPAGGGDPTSGGVRGGQSARREAVCVGLPQLEMVEDPTDTWTHEVDRYDGQAVAASLWDQTRVIDFGPLMGSLQQRGRIGRSDVTAEWRVYAGEPFVELLLRVYWSERHKLLKLTVPLAAPIARRRDGIPGGELQRPSDGREHPVRDRTLLELADGTRVGLLLPDAYALDATNGARSASEGFSGRDAANGARSASEGFSGQGDGMRDGSTAAGARVRITLLRSPLMAHDYRFHTVETRGVYADHGMHEFRFRFFAGADVTGDLLDRHALMLHRPLLAADWTRGMSAS